MTPITPTPTSTAISPRHRLDDFPCESTTACDASLQTSPALHVTLVHVPVPAPLPEGLTTTLSSANGVPTSPGPHPSRFERAQ
ncbi:hypothetical protein B0T16DRAFT_409876 [Cercophora newfieldiana]|uniref:Uncharacterized protein n=1 Tax=Cercophora newfieldiana TaxID=92897 RepID=A0AA40CU53_9PEZI|nr:hypothetical protein B0T16DRAFT_409876 [Cercophora newfieldiana]